MQKQKPATPEIREAIDEWQKVVRYLNKAVDRERELRAMIVKYHFEELREGTQKVDTVDGWEIKADVPVNRSVDEAVIQTVLEETWNGATHSSDEVRTAVAGLIRWKPEIVMEHFRKLDERTWMLFSRAYSEKPGLAQLSIKAIQVPLSDKTGVAGLAAQHDHPDFKKPSLPPMSTQPSRPSLDIAPVPPVPGKKRGPKPKAKPPLPAQAAGTKRGRGRPPGSKNKPKQ